MTATPILALTEHEQSQALQEVVANEAYRWLEFFASGGAVLDRGLLDPSGLTPSDGDAYLIDGAGAGAWAGQDGKIALYISTAWAFKTPTEGMQIYVKDEDVRIIYDGVAWDTPAGSSGAAAKRFFSFAVLGSAPSADEALAAWTPPNGETVTFADDFAGCVGKKIGGGTNPASSYSLVVKKNGSDVGTITIATDGTVTFATTGTTVSLTGGTDTLTIYGATTPDTAVGFAFTMAGDL